MKKYNLSAALLCLALLACGPKAETPEASAEQTGASAQSVSASDRTAILSALSLRADAQGQVENECGDKVTPQFLPADIGAGRAILFVMVGGESMASCYGDGPGLTLLLSSGSAWREIYSSRGGYLAILDTTHHGARDLAFAGPGFSHETYYFDGTSYASSGQSVADAAMEHATVLP